jgi:3-deoxy-manno-octulosonate cytidylyltransferase (CMP-KDO synthetase)
MQRKIKKTIGIIPARYASTRFPGKPLVDIAGKSMIQRVYEQAKQVPDLSAVYVATDDARIFEHVKRFGGEAIMTLDSHQSGTDRCAEVLELLADIHIGFVVNIQGDEPFISPEQIQQLIDIIKGETNEDISHNPPLATLAKQIKIPKELFNDNVVKVVFDDKLSALYFSRNPIPFVRGKEREEWMSSSLFFKHIGLYAYRAEVLRAIAKLPAGRLEKAESLEQLRWLENGYAIQCGITEKESIGIDTPEDLEGLQIT